jgi:hypothetical protein
MKALEKRWNPRKALEKHWNTMKSIGMPEKALEFQDVSKTQHCQSNESLPFHPMFAQLTNVDFAYQH